MPVENTAKPRPMSNRKEVREQLLNKAGWDKLLVCKSCRRAYGSSICKNLQCPFCGGNMVERGWLPPRRES